MRYRLIAFGIVSICRTVRFSGIPRTAGIFGSAAVFRSRFSAGRCRGRSRNPAGIDDCRPCIAVHTGNSMAFSGSLKRNVDISVRRIPRSLRTVYNLAAVARRHADRTVLRINQNIAVIQRF